MNEARGPALLQGPAAENRPAHISHWKISDFASIIGPTARSPWFKSRSNGAGKQIKHMSWYSKVLWSEGLFLRPQHLQQQDRHHEWWVEARARSLGSHFWGFLALELDAAALLSGKLALDSARGVLPDVTPFDFPAVDEAPAALEVPAGLHGALVYLTLPLRRPDSLEAARPEQPAGLARYRYADAAIIDSSSGSTEAETIEIGQPRLTLALDDAGEGLLRLAVARVVERRPDNSLVLDRDFIPPLLSCRASPLLWGWLRELNALLAQRGQALAARLGQAGQGGIAEIADFILLLTINRQQPLLEHLAGLSQLHPERCFSALLGLHGELATLARSERRPLPLPPYEHDTPERCFLPLLREIRLGLASLQEPQAIPIELKDLGQGRYVGLIPDRSLLQASFVLAVKAQLPGETLRTRFPAQAKLGPVERLRDIVNLQLPGIRLGPLPVAPRQLPYHAGFSYFGLERSGELWQQLESSGGLGLYITGDYPGLELALWAIRS